MDPADDITPADDNVEQDTPTPDQEVEEPTEEPQDGTEEEGSDDGSEDESLTVEDLRDALKQVRREAAARRTENRELKDALKAAKSPEEVQSLIEEVEQKAEAERVSLIRESVAAKFGLSERVAASLQGSTREELEADAEEWRKELRLRAPSGNPPRGGIDPSEDDDDDFDPVALAHAGKRAYR